MAKSHSLIILCSSKLTWIFLNGLKFSVLAQLKKLYGLGAGSGHAYQRLPTLCSDHKLAFVIPLHEMLLPAVYL